MSSEICYACLASMNQSICVNSGLDQLLMQYDSVIACHKLLEVSGNWVWVYGKTVQDVFKATQPPPCGTRKMVK